MAIKSADGVSVKVLSVTPDLAAKWLEKNAESNRRAVRSRVRQYAADMAAGKWQLSDQPISFDAEGRLVNGQHRLAACVLAGKPFETLVLCGLPAASLLVLDSGKKRTTDDSMTVAGLGWPRGCGATVRRLFQGAASYAGRSFTDQEVDGFMRLHGRHVSRAHELLPKGRTSTAAARAVVTRALIAGKDGRRVADFCRVLTTGLMVPGDEAAVLLRNEMLEGSQHSGRNRAAIYCLAQSALKAFLGGVTPKSLRPAKDEVFEVPDEGYWFGEV